MYYDRYVEKEIEKKLKTVGAVVVAGPKFCGKTTTCMRYQKSYVKLNTKQAIDIAKLNPKAALIGENPHLIDEWQTVPDIWNQIKDDLDNEYVFGKYILTGSSTPADKTELYHSGAGRITTIKMRPMSLFESKESKGLVSLKQLFDKKLEMPSVMINDFDLTDVAFLICRGGWPISVLADKEIAVEITKNYYLGLFNFENSENAKFRNKNNDTIKMLLKSYARNISTEAPSSTIIKDVRQSNERTFDAKTYADYSEALKDLFIIEDMEAWNPNIRSKTVIRSTPTRHFTDTSIACGALSISKEDLLSDLNTMGLFFEDFAVRDLRIYSSVIDGKVYHYRDSAGLECDAIVHLEDGRWGAIEIKLGGDKLIEDGAASLKRLASKLENGGYKTGPSFLMVLTAVGVPYMREDGVYVVPINMLRD